MNHKTIQNAISGLASLGYSVERKQGYDSPASEPCELIRYRADGSVLFSCWTFASSLPGILSEVIKLRGAKP